MIISDVRGLLELVLEVNDLDRSLALYRDTFGLPVVERWSDPRPAVWLSIGRNEVLGLWPAASGGEGIAVAASRGGAHVHFAIYIEPGSLQHWQARLKEASLQVEGPIDFGEGKRSLFLKDPDGNVVELADWLVDWRGEPVVKQP